MISQNQIPFDDDFMISSKLKGKTTHLNKLIITKEKIEKEVRPDNNDKIINTFNEYFPSKTIKPLQYDIIKSVLDKNDTVAILPTGYGKSMCYQLPYLIDQSKVVIVISPLISLMEDQKDKLEKLKVRVTCFHSNVNKKKRNEIKSNLMDQYDDPFIDDNNSECKEDGMIIFLTPEYIMNCENWIKNLAIHNKLTLLAIDEAHCISTWGHDFRPEYQGLYRLKEWIKQYKIPILALTATATQHVENDIKTFLELDNPKIFKTSFDRPNLNITVLRKPKLFSDAFKLIDKYNNDFIIVYCKTRDKSTEICNILQENGYNADVYHAGLDAKVRQNIQEKFANKELNIIVATIAFGMGIDQNIHLVIHWGCPADMESYYQEIGRAGRDGIESDCYMYFDKEDFKISRYFLKSIVDKKYHMFRDEQISNMERYCLLAECRRKMILKHFGEKLNDDYACNKCDNCKKIDDINNLATNKLAYPIYIIVKTIFSIKCKLGAKKIYLITKGSKSKLISEFNKCVTYGLLKDLNEDQIDKIIKILIINKYLREKTIVSGLGTVLETTQKLVSWYTKIYYASKNNLSFDVLEPILSSREHILTLNIPTGFKDIINIKLKTTYEKLKDDFGDLLE